MPKVGKKTSEALGTVGNIADPANILGGGTWGDTSKEDAEALRAKGRSAEEQTLNYAKDLGAKNAKVWDNVSSRINGSPTGYVDEYGNPIRPDDITKAQEQAAGLADGSIPRDRPPGVPPDAVRAVASNGQIYWRYPGYGKDGDTEHGWVTGADGEWFGATPEDDARTKDYWEGVEKTAQATATPQDPSRTYGGKLAQSNADDRSAADKFIEQIQQYNDPGKLFNDPNFMGYQGDAQSSKEGQLKALGKLEPLTDTSETAAEKFMRMMAQQKQENQLKGDREAMQQNLKQRGVYGSGAEIASQLGSQQATAITRAQDEMAANANAQQRSMQALGQYSDLQNSIRGNDSAEAMFNSNLKQNAATTQAQEKLKQANTTEAEKAKRIASELDANNQVTQNRDTRLGNEVTTNMNLANGVTGSNNQAAALTVPQMNRMADSFKTEAATVEANKPSGGLIGVFNKR